MSGSGVLVTGATGTTGSRVAAAARSAGAQVRTASRHGSDVRFDWHAADTWPAALHSCLRVYLVPPPGLDVAPVMVPFIEFARHSGVERLVLLSNSVFPMGGPGVGAVHQALADGSDDDFVVLRPSWFMQNVTGDHVLARMIRDEDRIVTATGEGRVGFIDVDDIAAVAVHALLDEMRPAAELVLTGPEALSYRRVAEIVGAARGRPVAFEPVTPAELSERLARTYPPPFAQALADLDAAIAAGVEDRLTPDVERVAGRPPRSFEAFAATAFWSAG
jgi:uncharacterized protein YbjT (DUF2867 family)